MAPLVVILSFVPPAQSPAFPAVMYPTFSIPISSPPEIIHRAIDSAYVIVVLCSTEPRHQISFGVDLLHDVLKGVFVLIDCNFQN